jgi:simple sugar transport system ATP-binding protein
MALGMPLIEMRDIKKSYGKVRALEGADLTVYENEIVGLLGDNGAGKSTLIKVLSGAVPATSGEIFIRGQKVASRARPMRSRTGSRRSTRTRRSSPSSRSPGTSFLGREPVRARGFSTAWTRTR